MKEKSSKYILDFLEELYPDKLPVRQVSEYELGILVGQRQLIEVLKVKLKMINKEDIEEIK